MTAQTKKRCRMEEEKVYTLTVRGKENYDLLCATKDRIELASDLLREKNQAGQPPKAAGESVQLETQVSSDIA